MKKRLAVALLCALASGCVRPAPAAPLWEYKVVDVEHMITPEGDKWAEHPEQMLNELGAQKWELVGVASNAEGRTDAYFLKRPKV